jgi:signal transduction histidine kinase
MPLGPIALLEQSELLRSMGDSSAALKSGVGLYRGLVQGQWELERAQYDFLAGRAAAVVQVLSTALRGPVPDSLFGAFEATRVEESQRRERAQRALLLQETASEDLLARLDSNARGPGPRRVSLETGGQAFLVSMLDGSESDSGVWGLLLDARYLRQALLLPALESQVDTSTTEWMVRGRDGRTVLAGTDSPSGSLALNATIAGNFPPWLIEFYHRPQSPYRLLLASGQSTYLYMFLAIATILGFGLVLTIRTVTHELELARLKSDFVSTVSHEFKSPLTSIRQLAEMLQTGRVPSEERRQHYYDVLVEQSSGLSSLVTNVLDLARIEEGREEFHFEPVDLGALVRDLVETTQHRVGHDGFDVIARVTDPLPRVRGDVEALRQAVSNLLNNAIQYSDEAREVNVTVSAVGGVVRVAVEDFGVGIPEEEIGKVFDRFYRGSDELARSIRGSGLGLTLVKETVKAHAGSVEVTSRSGEGSTFCIELPALTHPNHG